MSQWITNATDSDFGVEVIEKSREVPVLVDFWASWCQPCKILGPLLEKTVEERRGDVMLVKVNVEQNPTLAATYQVQGVPVVKAFVDGEVKDEFVGLRDRRAIEAFIDAVAPSVEERALDRAGGLLALGRAADVHPLVSPLLEHRRYRERAQILSARAYAAQGELDRAGTILKELEEENPESETVRGMLLKLELIMAAGEQEEQTLATRVQQEPKDLEARWALAGRRYALGDVPGALEELLEILMRNRVFREDAARRVMLAIFEEIGINHDISNQFRRQMQIYL